MTEPHPLPRPPLVARPLPAARLPLAEAGLVFPLLTLRESALASNLEAMAAYCTRAGVALAPHGKTAMSPELHGKTAMSPELVWEAVPPGN